MSLDIVVASDQYPTFRIPGYVREALSRWSQSSDYPKDVPMQIVDGDLLVDLNPPETRVILPPKEVQTPFEQWKRRKKSARKSS